MIFFRGFILCAFYHPSETKDDNHLSDYTREKITYTNAYIFVLLSLGYYIYFCHQIIAIYVLLAKLLCHVTNFFPSFFCGPRIFFSTESFATLH